jgi:hypothetical protein
VGLFVEPIPMTERKRAELAVQETAALKLQQQIARLEEVGDGPKRLEDRLSDKLEGDDFATHRLERMRQEARAVSDRLTQDRGYVDDRVRALAAEREAFQAMVADREALLENEDFKRAVETLEQLKPAQAKDVVRVLMAEGKKDQVVEYLAAMDLRKSAGVLKQFKGPGEVEEAAVLIEAIRLRRVDDMRDRLAEAGV